MELLFVTGNKGKLDEITRFLDNSGITLVHKHLDLVEPRSESLEEIAKSKAKDALKTVKQPFMVDDSGLFIACLNGFPGTNSNWVFKKIGYPSILKLLEGKKDRTAEFRCAIALSIPGKEIIVFEGIEHGTITNDARRTAGFGYDPIFIPDGCTKTWGQAPEVKNIHSHRQLAIEKMMKWIKENPQN